MAYEDKVTLVVEEGASVDGRMPVSEIEVPEIDDEIPAAELEILDVGDETSAVVAALKAEEVEVELSIAGVPSTLLPPSPTVLAKKILSSSFIPQQLCELSARPQHQDPSSSHIAIPLSEVSFPPVL